MLATTPKLSSANAFNLDKANLLFDKGLIRKNYTFIVQMGHAKIMSCLSTVQDDVNEYNGGPLKDHS